MRNLTRVEDSHGGSTEYSYDARNLLVGARQTGIGVNPKRVDLDVGLSGETRQVARYASLDGSAPVGTTEVDYTCPVCVTSVSRIDHLDADGDRLDRLQFVRDPIGNILTRTDGEGAHAYTYDPLDQILTADHPAAAAAGDESYSYDDYGNRTSSHRSAAYTCDDAGRLTRDDAVDYTYDLEGNLATRRDRTTGATTTYEYDHRNRLVEVDLPGAGATVGYVYDSANRLIRRLVDGVTVESYVHDPINRTLTFGAGGAIVERRFTLPSVDEVVATEIGGDTGWLLTDQVGTVRRIVGDDGASLATFTHDSFGNLATSTGATATDLRFQSREFDDLTGLGYFRTRFYDAGTGRFLGEDPREPFGYDFASNNPLTGVDPFGEATLFEYKIIIGGRAFSIAVHSGHHSWRILGKEVFCIHLQLLTYIVGGRPATSGGSRFPCRGARATGSEMDGSSASGPSPVDLEPGPDFVEVRIRRRYPAGPIFEAIAGALPSGLTLYLEGATMVPAVAEYLAARPAAHAHPVKPGTILPRPKAFHMPLTPVNVTGLIDLLGRHAAPEVAEHVHAYSGPAAYLIWHDAWFDSPLYLRRSVPRDALERTCEALGCELSVVPA